MFKKKKSKTEMTASVQAETNQNTQEVKMNAIESGLDKTKCTFSANFAFDAATYAQRKNIRCKTTDMSRTYLDVTYLSTRQYK